MNKRPINEKNWKPKGSVSDRDVFLAGTIALILVGLGSLTARILVDKIDHATNARLFASAAGCLTFALICLILLKYGSWEDESH